MAQSATTADLARASALTRQAIRYAVHLDRLGVPAAALSQAVYDFNRLPLAALPGYAGSAALADAAEAELAASGRRPADRYARSLAAESRWIYWMREGQAAGARLRHKLYVSPAVRALQPTLALVMRLADAHRVPSFKLGLDALGILRSDKLVVYFPEPDARRRFAADLLRQADGLEAQGVPLTRPLDNRGLVSSAEDPLLGDLSWRQLISAEIVEMAAAQRAAPTIADAVDRTWAELARRGFAPALVGEA